MISLGLYSALELQGRGDLDITSDKSIRNHALESCPISADAPSKLSCMLLHRGVTFRTLLTATMFTLWTGLPLVLRYALSLALTAAPAFIVRDALWDRS